LGYFHPPLSWLVSPSHCLSPNARPGCPRFEAADPDAAFWAAAFLWRRPQLFRAVLARLIFACPAANMPCAGNLFYGFPWACPQKSLLNVLPGRAGNDPPLRMTLRCRAACRVQSGASGSVFRQAAVLARPYALVCFDRPFAGPIRLNPAYDAWCQPTRPQKDNGSVTSGFLIASPPLTTLSGRRDRPLTIPVRTRHRMGR